MTVTPHINDVLEHAKDDLKAMGSAAREDFSKLRHNAGDLAQEHLLKPAQEAKDWASKYADRSAEDLRDYTVKHPFRALAIAAVGGVLLSFLFRGK